MAVAGIGIGRKLFRQIKSGEIIVGSHRAYVWKALKGYPLVNGFKGRLGVPCGRKDVSNPQAFSISHEHIDEKLLKILNNLHRQGNTKETSIYYIDPEYIGDHREIGTVNFNKIMGNIAKAVADFEKMKAILVIVPNKGNYCPAVKLCGTVWNYNNTSTVTWGMGNLAKGFHDLVNDMGILARNIHRIHHLCDPSTLAVNDDKKVSLETCYDRSYPDFYDHYLTILLMRDGDLFLSHDKKWNRYNSISLGIKFSNSGISFRKSDWGHGGARLHSSPKDFNANIHCKNPLNAIKMTINRTAANENTVVTIGFILNPSVQKGSEAKSPLINEFPVLFDIMGQCREGLQNHKNRNHILQILG